MTDKPDVLRLFLTFAMALAGIVIVMIAFIIALQVYRPGNEGIDKSAESVAAVLGPVVAVIGTLTGYVAGQSAGLRARRKPKIGLTLHISS